MARTGSGKEKEEERTLKGGSETRLKSKLIDDQYFCRCAYFANRIKILCMIGEGM